MVMSCSDSDSDCVHYTRDVLLEIHAKLFTARVIAQHFVSHEEAGYNERARKTFTKIKRRGCRPCQKSPIGRRLLHVPEVLRNDVSVEMFRLMHDLGEQGKSWEVLQSAARDYGEYMVHSWIDQYGGKAKKWQLCLRRRTIASQKQRKMELYLRRRIRAAQKQDSWVWDTSMSTRGALNKDTSR